jgi:hypothetical protein
MFFIALFHPLMLFEATHGLDGNNHLLNCHSSLKKKKNAIDQSGSA